MRLKINDGKYYGIYRGIVLDNNDPGIDKSKKGFGRCKIFFEGIYPEKYRASFGKLLPWAEPIFPIFGGNAYTETQKQTDNGITPPIIKNWTNKYTGWCSIPHIGAYVWGFFQDGNINYPKFFGMTQAGNNFMCEHKDQHVFCSDNVRIVIDENPLNEKSTAKYDSNNKNCDTKTVKNKKTLKKEKMPTTVNIEITAKKPSNDKSNKQKNDFCAINLKIIGNVNSSITGNVYEEITGDKFITHKGNSFIKHIGDVEILHEGDTYEKHIGNRNFELSDKGGKGGNNTEIISGEEKITVKKDKTNIYNGNQITKVSKADKRQANQKISDKSNLITHN